jgi:hypothetical protein
MLIVGFAIGVALTALIAKAKITVIINDNNTK